MLAVCICVVGWRVCRNKIIKKKGRGDDGGLSEDRGGDGYRYRFSRAVEGIRRL